MSHNKKLKIVMSTDLLREIEDGSPSEGALYGRDLASQDLVQVIGRSNRFRGLLLEPVGRWSKGVVYVKEQAISLSSIGSRSEHKCELELYDLSEYHSRHRQLKISEKLCGKKAAIIGLGSLGSKIALELGKHNVGLLLFDPDDIEIQNPYRLGLSQPPEFQVGQSKADAMTECLAWHGREDNVHAFPIDVAEQYVEFREQLEKHDPDLLILVTDTYDSIVAVNSYSRDSGVPVLHAVLSDGAESGQMHFVSGEGDDPCLLCLVPDNAVMRPTRRQYAEVTSVAQAAVPSLSVDTGLIALLTAKLATAFLAGEKVSTYFAQGEASGSVFWFSTSPKTWILEDFAQKLVAEVEKRPECPGCWSPSPEAILRKHAAICRSEPLRL